MAKKNNNFLKFIKLASLVKRIADKDPELLQQILDESESKSKNKWNKIQKWTSKNLFPVFKEKPLSELTEKNVKNALEGQTQSTKPSKCFNVFKIPTADLGDIEPFDLELTLMSFPPNLQVEIDLGGNITTGISKIKDLPNVGNGDLTKDIRTLYPDLQQIKFVRLRKKGKKDTDRSNCSYYIKAMFVDDELSPSEAEREAVIGVSVSQLTPKQQEERKALKRLIAERKKKKSKSKAEKRKFKTPTKVTSTKEDKKIQAKIKKARDPRALADALKTLQKDFELGVFNKEEYKKERSKLIDKFEKGGEI